MPGQMSTWLTVFPCLRVHNTWLKGFCLGLNLRLETEDWDHANHAYQYEFIAY